MSPKRYTPPAPCRFTPAVPDHTLTLLNQTPSSASQVDATPRLRPTGERALVLGGGGASGNAWLIGVIAGLFDRGLDATEADLIVGTSAGSTAAVQVTSMPPPELFAAVLSAPPPRRPAPAGSDSGRALTQVAANQMERTAKIIAAAEDAADMRRRLGAAALELDAAADDSRQTQWRTIVGSRLPSQDWPQQTVLITAVDARTGKPVVFDRHSGVDLVDAVAASTSSGRPYSIGEDRYIDGGYRRNENADLAAGYERVLVLSPFGGRSRHPREWGTDLSSQVDELRAGGSRVETIFPGSDAEHMFGANAVDISLREAAARVGHEQGQALADRLAEFWR